MNFAFLHRFKSQILRGARVLRSGFSLVELLVVVGIIMLVAASSLLVLDQTDDQARYNKTRQEYKEISTALFGPDMMTTLGGNLVISGYLADTGKLPETLEDLMVMPAGMEPWGPLLRDPATGLPVFAAKGIRLQHGWRGPYLSEREKGLSDPWGNKWEFFRMDKGIVASARYRPGYMPPAPPPAIKFGSYGKNGTPNLPENPEIPETRLTDDYDRDFPDVGMEVMSARFVLESVPIPARVIEKQSVDTVTYYVGVLYPGLNMMDSFVDDNGNYHPSLLRKPGTNELFSMPVPGRSSSSDKDDKDDKDDDDDDKDDEDDNSGSGGSSSTGSTRGKALDAGLTFNLGYARQIQLALYVVDPSNSIPNRLVTKLYSADPVILTYYPKVNSSGAEAVLQNSGTGPWLIP